MLVAVADDGGGIDCEAVRQRAIERGLVPPDAQLSEEKTFALLFEAGFSTAKQITDVSGRGVGMDVVRQRVEALRGTIEVTSERGAGTSVTLRLPLTLAIIPTAVSQSSSRAPMRKSCAALTRCSMQSCCPSAKAIAFLLRSPSAKSMK